MRITSRTLPFAVVAALGLWLSGGAPVFAADTTGAPPADQGGQAPGGTESMGTQGSMGAPSTTKHKTRHSHRRHHPSSSTASSGGGMGSSGGMSSGSGAGTTPMAPSGGAPSSTPSK